LQTANDATMDWLAEERRLVVELEKITAALEAELGRPSRWSGAALLMDLDQSGFGLARFDGTIRIRIDRWQDDIHRWRTLIHEGLHYFSPALSAQAYLAHQGWEEGVVEQLQRLLRPLVLRRLGIVVPEDMLKAGDVQHAYNGYIEALEGVRTLLGADERRFYERLLSLPLVDRPLAVRRMSDTLSETERAEFTRVFLLKAQAVLTRDHHGSRYRY
jgi:hypothetical protein